MAASRMICACCYQLIAPAHRGKAGRSRLRGQAVLNVGMVESSSRMSRSACHISYSFCILSHTAAPSPKKLAEPHRDLRRYRLPCAENIVKRLTRQLQQARDVGLAPASRGNDDFAQQLTGMRQLDLSMPQASYLP
jgi:hypothetical protein